MLRWKIGKKKEENEEKTDNYNDGGGGDRGRSDEGAKKHTCHDTQLTSGFFWLTNSPQHATAIALNYGITLHT